MTESNLVEEGMVRIRVMSETYYEVHSEFSSEAEVRELVQRCMYNRENGTAVSVREAITAQLEQPPASDTASTRVGYTKDGNKDAYLGEDVAAKIISIEMLHPVTLPKET